jgi:hypothetical protein
MSLRVWSIQRPIPAGKAVGGPPLSATGLRKVASDLIPLSPLRERVGLVPRTAPVAGDRDAGMAKGRGKPGRRLVVGGMDPWCYAAKGLRVELFREM